jgi:hypothetical protein
LNRERLNTFPPKCGRGPGCSPSPLLGKTTWHFSQRNQAREINKRDKNKKGGNQITPACK